jgi:hypothetical protein
MYELSARQSVVLSIKINECYKNDNILKYKILDQMFFRANYLVLATSCVLPLINKVSIAKQLPLLSNTQNYSHVLGTSKFALQEQGGKCTVVPVIDLCSHLLVTTNYDPI